MQIQVLYFGVLKDAVGLDREAVELSSASSVAALMKQLEERHGATLPAAKALWRSLAIAVNQEYVRGEVLLHDGDEVALLPPVSGGLEEEVQG